jgi:hypothetical protein
MSWLDDRRALLTVTGPAELHLVRNGWHSPTLLTTDGPVELVLPDIAGGPRDSGWQPQPGDVWCAGAVCSAPLDVYRWRVWGA